MPVSNGEAMGGTVGGGKGKGEAVAESGAGAGEGEVVPAAAPVVALPASTLSGDGGAEAEPGGALPFLAAEAEGMRQDGEGRGEGA